MKRPLLLLGLALLGVVGCSSAPDAGAAGSPSAQADKPLKVALLTPGPVSDSGWNAMAYNGLTQIKTELGATVDNQQTSVPQIKDAMRSYAQKGYDIVFGHGFEYNAPEVQIAKDFPKTVFVSSSGGKTAPNAGAFRFYLEQGCYLAGVMAGKMSKTGTVGSVAVSDIPSIVSTLKAFEAGAKAANPKIRVIPTVYFGTEGDIAGAKQATQQVIAQGADFVIHQANSAAQGVFDACKEKGAWAIGTNADQNGNPSGCVIGSAVIVAGPAFLDLAKQVKTGTYKGSVQLMGMDIGAIDFVTNPSLRSQVPESVRSQLEKVRADIKSGKLTVPKDEF